MEYTTKRKQEPITLDGTEYILREMGGLERDEFLQYSTRGVKVNDEGKADIASADLRGQSAMLISLSIFTKEMQPAFTKEQIQMWAASTIEDLYNICAKLSGMDRKAKAAAKNE